MNVLRPFIMAEGGVFKGDRVQIATRLHRGLFFKGILANHNSDVPCLTNYSTSKQKWLILAKLEEAKWVHNECSHRICNSSLDPIYPVEKNGS